MILTTNSSYQIGMSHIAHIQHTYSSACMHSYALPPKRASFMFLYEKSDNAPTQERPFAGLLHVNDSPPPAKSYSRVVILIILYTVNAYLHNPAQQLHPTNPNAFTVRCTKYLFDSPKSNKNQSKDVKKQFDWFKVHHKLEFWRVSHNLTIF
jgi:hypothetical protein